MVAAAPVRPWWWSDTALLLYLGILKAGLNFLTNGNYGYFRDELYYIACSEHLDWGYVDHPPLSIVILAATRALLGDSIFAIRLPAVLAGSACVVLTGFLARAMGGGRVAQWLAALAYLTVGTALAISTFFSMNVFDQLFWIGAALIVVRLIDSGSPRWWVPFGVVIGLGMLNKISIGFFVFALLVGLAVTPQRALLRSRWLLVGGAIAALFFLPHVLWQVGYGFPTLEFIRNAQQYKIVSMSPAQYLGAQIVETNPFTLPIWLAGLGALLFGRRLRPFRCLGVAYLTALAVFLLQSAKPYYLAPAYPMLIAAGACVVEALARRRGLRLLPAVAGVWLVAGGLCVAPLTLPLLSPDDFVRYARLIGMQPPREERSAPAELPQYFADRFGWENMVATVARAFAALPSDERAQAAILTGNYGEAGAVDFFGRAYGLPRAISGHNSYWLWGPGTVSGNVVIAVGIPRTELQQVFESVEQVDMVVSPYAVPYETRLPVFVCRRLRVPLPQAWSRMKHFV
jgi:4-amino-4-deoxy-L-arabinose transferase-like glycosyltransferase